MAIKVYLDGCFRRDLAEREKSADRLPSEPLDDLVDPTRVMALSSDSAMVGLAEGACSLTKPADMRRDRLEAADTDGAADPETQSAMQPTSSNSWLRTRSGPREFTTGPNGAEIDGRCKRRRGMLS